MMTIQLDTALLGKGEPWRLTSLLKHVQCHVGMYYSYTEADSAQSIAASTPAEH